MAWWANVLGFQACWLAFVAGAASGRWWLGFVALLPFVAWTMARSAQPRVDAMLAAAAVVLGLLVDSLLASGGLVHYDAPLPWPGVAPLWILGMWVAFALTLNHSLAFLQQRLVFSAVVGAVSAPLAYAIAERAWSAVVLTAPTWRAFVALAVAWAVVTPLLLVLASRWSRAARIGTPATATP